jgi:ethanolaminephosphotransferase
MTVSLLGARARAGLIVRYLLSIVAALAGTAIFFAAFFPGSRGPGEAARADGAVRPPRPGAEGGGGRQRVVIMLVDALRADFIWQTGSRFAFVNDRIAAGEALPFTTRAHSPTVTLPRIKSMITGSIPGFLDIKANLDSPALKEDNVVAKAVAAGRRVLMFGDETWLKLFPSSFTRSDGTTAFFVLDTQVVDDNVTRHVMPELENQDWDVMILHYLGLDHAGHLGGTSTETMRTKQEEMDALVRQMHSRVRELEEQDSARTKTTIILCSDHGMNSGGNHGGASEPETDAVAVFMAPPLPPPSPSSRAHPLHPPGKTGAPFPVVWQLDMAATLALMMELEVPAGNIGRVLPGVLDFMELLQYLDALQENVRQLNGLVVQRFHEGTDLAALYSHGVSSMEQCRQHLARRAPNAYMAVATLRRMHAAVSSAEVEAVKEAVEAVKEAGGCVLDVEAELEQYMQLVCGQLEDEQGAKYDMPGMHVSSSSYDNTLSHHVSSSSYANTTCQV